MESLKESRKSVYFGSRKAVGIGRRLWKFLWKLFSVPASSTRFLREAINMDLAGNV
jgi:hypothetical protein